MDIEIAKELEGIKAGLENHEARLLMLENFAQPEVEFPEDPRIASMEQKIKILIERMGSLESRPKRDRKYTTYE